MYSQICFHEFKITWKQQPLWFFVRLQWALYLQRELILFHRVCHVALPCFRSSTEQTAMQSAVQLSLTALSADLLRLEFEHLGSIIYYTGALGCWEVFGFWASKAFFPQSVQGRTVVLFLYLCIQGTKVDVLCQNLSRHPGSGVFNTDNHFCVHWREIEKQQPAKVAISQKKSNLKLFFTSLQKLLTLWEQDLPPYIRHSAWLLLPRFALRIV